MKKYMLMGLLLMAGFGTFAQAKTAAKKDAKWEARLRLIAAVPPSSSYTLSGSDIKISTSVVPELDFTYYFTQNLAAELILGTTKHTVSSQTGSAAKTDLGKVWLLPPTLNLQYHIPLKGVTPYVGAGINYTIFYGAKAAALDLSYKNKVGFSTQVGCDFKISDNWFLNVDVKKIFLKTDVNVKTPALVLQDVKVNPFIFGIGIGTKF